MFNNPEKRLCLPPLFCLVILSMNSSYMCLATKFHWVCFPGRLQKSVICLPWLGKSTNLLFVGSDESRAGMKELFSSKRTDKHIWKMERFFSKNISHEEKCSKFIIFSFRIPLCEDDKPSNVVSPPACWAKMETLTEAFLSARVKSIMSISIKRPFAKRVKASVCQFREMYPHLLAASLRPFKEVTWEKRRGLSWLKIGPYLHIFRALENIFPHNSIPVFIQFWL